jgi:hypothetical protein
MSRPIGLTIKKYTTSQLNALVTNYGPSGVIQANSIDVGTVVYDKTVNRVKSFNGTSFITSIDSVVNSGAALSGISDVPGLQAALDGKAAQGTVINITASRAVTDADDGKTLIFTGAFTLTIGVGLKVGFGFAAKPPGSGNATIAFSGGATGNGGATSITRSGTSYFAVIATSSSNTYDVTDAATGGAGVTDGSKGDITVSNTGATWTIASSYTTARDAVANAKVENNMTASTTVAPAKSAVITALGLKADLASPTFTGTVSGITKSMIGLGNVDNTSNATERTAVATLTNKTLTSPIINGATGNIANSSITSGIQSPGWNRTYTYTPGVIGSNTPITIGDWVDYVYSSANNNSGIGHSSGAMSYFKKTGAGDPIMGISYEGRYENQHASTQTEHNVFQANISSNIGTIITLVGFNSVLSNNAGPIAVYTGHQTHITANTNAITYYLANVVKADALGAGGSIDTIVGYYFSNMAPALGSTVARRSFENDDPDAPVLSASLIIDASMQTISPATGFTHTAPAFRSGVAIMTGVAVAAGTVILPTDQLFDGQKFGIMCNTGVTSLTITAGAQTVFGWTTGALTPTTPVSFRYVLSSTAWVRCN